MKTHSTKLSPKQTNFELPILGAAKINEYAGALLE